MTTPEKSKAGGNPWNNLIKSVQHGIDRTKEEMGKAQEAKEAGKVWNNETKQWHFYLIDEELTALQEEAAEIEASDSTNTASSTQERKVADREYYDLLGVSTNADSVMIKKAYRKAALKCHPDRNPGDPEAHAKFQQLGQAYQVLSDENLRAAYDRDGKSEQQGAEAMQQVDPSIFFNVMFGSSLIEPYVGELWLASQFMGGKSFDLQAMEQMSQEEQNKVIMEKIQTDQAMNERRQKLRQVQCAVFLRERISTYNPNDKDSFIRGCHEEAAKIGAGAYGDAYLLAMGFALEVAADEYTGFANTFLGLGGHVARTKKLGAGIASGMKLLGAGVKAATAGTKAMKEAEDLQRAVESGKDVDDSDAQQMAATLEGTLPAFLELAWAVNKRDIQSTLRAVCKKVFDDASVPKEERMVRAKAVRILGRQFQLVGKQARLLKKKGEELSIDDIQARMAVATMTSMAKAQGQDITDEDQAEMLRQVKRELHENDPLKRAENETPTESNSTSNK